MTNLIMTIYVTYFSSWNCKPIMGAITDIYPSHSQLKNPSNSSFYFGWFCGTGVWTHSFALGRQELYCLSHASSSRLQLYYQQEQLLLVCMLNLKSHVYVFYPREHPFTWTCIRISDSSLSCSKCDSKCYSWTINPPITGEVLAFLSTSLLVLFIALIGLLQCQS
jgi:hypothetical protein